MPSPKYPLKPLLEHRERQVEDATAELGTKLRAHEAAGAARTRAEAERRDAETRSERVRAEERERLLRGDVRAGDLVRAADWEVGATAEIDALAHAVRAAERAVEVARDEEVAARARLGERTAERDVVAKDEGRFTERLRKRASSADEEAAEEAFRGGRG